MKIELLIHGDTHIIPTVLDGMQWATERRGTPGKLTFSIPVVDGEEPQEGNAVQLKVDGKNMFCGFIFTKIRSKDGIMKITAYDQLRYLKNKDVKAYDNKTASDVIKMIASEYRLQLGEINDTSYVIPTRIEDNTTLFDMIYNALDLDRHYTGIWHVFYDDFGKLTLKKLDDMKVNLLIDDGAGEDFDYKSTIDEATYNRIKLSYESEEGGGRDLYMTQDGEHMNDWGILQYYDKLQEGENGQEKVEVLLRIYNTKTRTLRVSNVFGDTRIRAGSLIMVNLHLGGERVVGSMWVEKCTHTFKESEHFMDLDLRGGEYVG